MITRVKTVKRTTVKKIAALCLSVVAAAVSLAGCSKEQVHYADVADEYVKTLEYHDGFVILQLTDIHWNSATLIGNDEYGSKAHIKRLVKATQEKFGDIDLIEITGDTFCLNNSGAVKEFIKMMEEIGVNYAITWGNHDFHNKYNPNWLCKKFSEAPYSLYTEVDNDDLTHRGNYVLNLTENGETVWQIFNIDTGSNRRESLMGMGLVYDYIHPEQVEWFEFMHQRVGENVPVMCYYHIPQKDFQNGLDAILEDESGYKSKFYRMERVACGPDAPALNDVYLRNNVRGVFVGHDHSNDWTFTNPDGITYGFGVKTGKELYKSDVTSETLKYDEIVNEDPGREFDQTGASVVKLLNKSGDFELHHLYMNDDNEEPVEIWEEY